MISAFLLSNMLNVITGRFTLPKYHFPITCYENIHLKMSSTVKSCLLHGNLYVNDSFGIQKNSVDSYRIAIRGAV